MNHKHNDSMIAAFTATLLFTAPVARADEPRGKNASDAERIETLENEVAILKQVMSELFVLEKAKTELIGRAIRGDRSNAADDVRDIRDLRDIRDAREAKLERDKSDRPEKAEPKRSAGKTTAQDRRSSAPVPAARDDLLGTVTGKVNSPNGAPAFVYIEDISGRMVRGRTVTIRQENKQFVPRWAVVQVGTKLEFPNNDPIYHNVFSRSPGNSMDLGIYRSGDSAKTWYATRSGVIDLFCNMHPNMSASVLVVPNNLHAQVKEDGTYVIPDVPKGRHKVVAWSPNSQPSSEWIEVTAGKEVSAELTLVEKGADHLNKLGQAYSSYRD